MGKMIDLTGKRFGMLTVIGYIGKEGREYYWRCKCDCGNEAHVRGRTLRSGETRSCGCLAGKNNLQHGEARSRLYIAYRNMMSRCYNPNNHEYYNYGGRGIRVCDEWREPKEGKKRFFEWAHANGYRDNLTIDRINNNGDYEPDNCRWVDAHTQAINRRIPRNSTLKVRGVSYHKHDKRYVATIGFHNQHICLGSYKTLEEAHAARKAAEMKYYGQVLD